MASEALLKQGTSICFAADDYAPATGTAFATAVSPSGAGITMDNVADGAGRISDKIDITRGTGKRAQGFDFYATNELVATPTSGDVIEYYWVPSPIAAVAQGNIAGNNGVDNAATQAGSGWHGSLTLDEFKALCQPIGTFPCSDDAAIQAGYVGYFEPAADHGQLLVVNESGAAFAADGVETGFVMVPVIPEGQ